MTDLNVGINYNPGVTYVNTKQQRLPINLDSAGNRTFAYDGLEGLHGRSVSQQHHQVGHLQAPVARQLGLSRLPCRGTGTMEQGAIRRCSSCHLSTSLYFEQETTISLMKDWEFLNDRQVFGTLSWDMNGKLLNRIPLIKKLKWREYFASQGRVGTSYR